MQYYKYPNPYITDDETAIEYIEIDNRGTFMRQLSVFEHYSISSNVDLHLADQPLEYEDIKDEENEIVLIRADEFNTVWRKHLEQHEARWNEAKKLFPINKPVICCMKVFFPQGIIVRLGEQVLGVTDYWQAKATAGAGFHMQTRRQMAGIVTGYDEVNQWIELGSPQIYTDKPCDSDTWQSPI
jgi:hypothetical protein